MARTPNQHRANGVDVRFRHEVMAIDKQAGTATVRDLEKGQDLVLPCDELRIATGASGVTPPWLGIDA